MIRIKYVVTFILLVVIVVVNVIMIGRPLKEEVLVAILSLYVIVLCGIFWKYW